MMENALLRIRAGRKKEDVMDKSRTLNNYEFYNESDVYEYYY